MEAWGVALLELQPTGPVIRWQPHDGRRHAYRSGGTTALCGVELVLRKASEREWLDDTCSSCRWAAWAIVNPEIPYPECGTETQAGSAQVNRGNVA